MKWHVIIPIAIVALYVATRNSAVALAILTFCGGVAWQCYQEKTTSLKNNDCENDGKSQEERMDKMAWLFFLSCLCAFLSGTVWGVVHGKGWWSILFGVGNLALFLFAAMVVAYYKVRAAI